MWQAYRVEVWSSCGGVAGGLVVPWYPQSPLLNTTHSPLTLTLSLLATHPLQQAMPPYLLLWSSSQCEMEVMVTSDPLSLLDKLVVVHGPLLLPWVTGLCISAPSRWIKVELMLLIILQLDWLPLPLAWDWVELQPLWSWCGPVVLHLLAYGLQQMLYVAVSLVAHACQAAFGRCGRGCSVILLVVSVFFLLLNSSITLLLAAMAILLQV